jgi:nitronate monooxygenase
MWPDRRLLDLLGLEHPIIQAPMAGADSPQLAAAVSAAGGLGSLGCAMRTSDDIVEATREIRRITHRPFNLNFFCHAPPAVDADRERRWLERLAPLYEELGITPPNEIRGTRAPFDAALCDLVCDLRPAVVSFHFGLPDAAYVGRVRDAGCRVLCYAPTPDEAGLLARGGVDAIIAQGYEAGGHRGVFATDWRTGSGQIGTLALVPQVVDAVDVPVIAAGGVGDGRGIAACFTLGASAIQIGTAYLFCPESAISELYRAALAGARADSTVLTNVFTGRPARGLANRATRHLGPIAADAPEFPRSAATMLPLRLAAEANQSTAFTSLWSGQSVALGRALPAGELTRALADEALALLQPRAH